MTGPANVRTQVADLVTARRATIAARKREIVTELRRLCHEEASLELVQLAGGTETRLVENEQEENANASADTEAPRA